MLYYYEDTIKIQTWNSIEQNHIKETSFKISCHILKIYIYA